MNIGPTRSGLRSDLSYANIDSRPVHYDWRSCWDRGEEPTYTVYEVARREEDEDTTDLGISCEECGEEVVIREGELNHRSLVDCDDLSVSEEDEVTLRYHNSWDGNSGPEQGLEGPMMNYYYPFDAPYRFDPKDAAVKLASVPLCLVEFEDGDYALALTGGGMDLSWSICEAFILLGQYPPTHFCDLPDYKNSDDDLSIIGACKQSVQAKMSQLGRTLDTLTSMEDKRI